MESYTLGPVSLVQVMVDCCLLLQGPGKHWHRLGRRRSTTWLSIREEAMAVAFADLSQERVLSQGWPGA